MQANGIRASRRGPFSWFFSHLLLIGLITFSFGVSTTNALPSRDVISDRIGVTKGQFQVDTSGSANYSIPIYTAPGTAGITPTLSFAYNSQWGNGPLGKGWAISGTSSISRCRATREHGDFFAGGVAIDGDPSPINFTGTDKFCLDGQRLIPAPVTAQVCKALSGATITQYRTELESFQRICEYRFILGDGPRFFTVERKDGSISWYGDRTATTGAATGTRTDSVIPVTATPSVFLTWAQTRFQDSTGNYIDYDYLNNPGGASYTGEQLLYQVRHTGKVVLPGQTGSAKSTYATVRFNYSSLPAADISSIYYSGMALYQTQRLDSVTVLNGSATVHFYAMTYLKSISGTNLNTLTSIKECSDASQATCYNPTTFDWSVARNQLSNYDTPNDLYIGSNDNFEGYKLADVDGDGRQDIVWLEDGNSVFSGGCATEYIRVGYGSIDASGRNTFTRVDQTAICSEVELMSTRGEDSWMLFDYNGDGRDDLFMTRATNSSWVIYPSLGRPTSAGKIFDNAQNLISGLSPAIPGSVKGEHPQLADFNGDGLLDVVYKTTSGKRARLMVRNGSSFNWGNELVVNFTSSLDSDCPVTATCERTSASLYQKNGSFQLLDLNGDSRSDLLVDYTKTYVSQGPGCEQQLQSSPSNSSSSASSGSIDEGSQLLANCNIHEIYKYLVTMEVTSITSTAINFNGGSAWLTSYSYNGAITTYQTEQRFGDFNGDGLTDMLTENGVNWYLYHNTGKTFVAVGASFNPSYSDYLQIVDVNGDGRSDVIYPRSDTSTFDVRYGLPTGGLSSASPMTGGVPLINCSDNCLGRFSYIFSDFDADGALDLFRIKWATASGGDPGQRLYSARGDNVSRFQPRDVIIRITNGFGAKTEVAYQPLTLKSIYLRDNNSRNGLNWGRGSPVQDLLGPMYVVAMARSSAPTYSDPNALNTTYYRYAGAKIQSGGRGYLGFREITTFDVNYGGKYTATTTLFSQNFPYIGNPLSTSQRVIAGTYTPDACYTAVTNSCFTAPGTTFPSIGGTLVSSNFPVWEASPAFNWASQEPLFVRLSGTQDERYDLNTSIRSSRVETAFTYGSFDNVLLTTVNTYSGASNSNPNIVSTSNTYVNDEANWRLSRMTASSSTYTRNGSSVIRTNGYSYDMSGPATGLLNGERVQPNGNWRQDLRTEYDLDEYGNRIGTYSCSQNITTCKTTVLNHSIWDSYNTVHRYTRVTFDADGRYPVTTHEPFRATGSAWDSGQNSDYITQTVLSRDEFGAPTQVQDVHGRVAAKMNGTMGREYWSWTPTSSNQTIGATGYGIHSFKTYRYCGVGTNQVACPSNAVFREQILVTGAATKWTYFDSLSRPILTTSQSFNENQNAKDFSATCQWYDSTGKIYGSSNPFFLTDAAVGSAPQFSVNPCVLASRDVTYNLYDVLGRPTQVILPDNSSTSFTYNGLSTVITNALNQTKIEVKNASGELITATDYLGFTTNYAYDAAGNLTSVTRNAGRGNIVTTMGYDTLGRKTSMVDPDSGSWTFDYTPAGEIERTVDVAGNAQFKRFDFRGRTVWEGKQTAANIGTATFESSAVSIYDSATYGLGQLQSSAITGLYTGWTGISGRNIDQSQAVSYDDMGRVQTTVTQIDGVSYPGYVVYDSLGRGYKIQDSTGKWTKTEYSPRGYVVRVCNTDVNDGAPGCISGNANTYIETLETDARGNVTSEKRGGSGSMITQRIFDPYTGRLTQLCTGSGGSNCQIMSEQYGWDAVGNLNYQEKSLYREEFSYDGLNRLTEGRFSRVGTTAYVGAARPYSLSNTYDQLGNICNKLIDGTNQNYIYAGRAGCGLNGSGGSVNADLVSSPHQVLSANGYTYAYDARGNQTVATHGTSSKTRTIAYSLDDRAYEMTKGSDVTRIWYGLDGNRYKRVDVSVVGTKTTINVGNVEIETLNGVTITKRNIAGVLIEETKNSVTTNKYLHYDQLGSVARITDASGSILESIDYAAFGDRRNVIDPRVPFNNAGQVTNGTLTLPGNQILVLYSTKHGFTGHEMIDGFDITHMNGRIYDNMVGRFLQADPMLQDSSNTQNFNRYTYVWNNPLAYTDPSGYFGISWALRVIGTALQWTGNPVLRVIGAVFIWASYAFGYVDAYRSGGIKSAFVQIAASYGMSKVQSSIPTVGGIDNANIVAPQAGEKYGLYEFGKYRILVLSTAEQDKAQAEDSEGESTLVPAYNFTSELTDEQIEGIKRRYSLSVQKVNDYRASNPGMIIPMSVNEFGFIAEGTLLQQKMRAELVGTYENGWAAWGTFPSEAINYGDSVFATWGNEVFDLSGFEGDANGLHCGCDINYIGEGMLFANSGYSKSTLDNAIWSWNTGQGIERFGMSILPGTDSGGLGGRDFRQIPKAQFWGHLGYDYLKLRSK